MGCPFGGEGRGGELFKETIRNHSNEQRELKGRKKQKERQVKETTPKPTRESASISLVVDPDSQTPRMRRDANKVNKMVKRKKQKRGM